MPNAEFFIGESDEPALVLPELITAILEREGFFGYVRRAAELPGYVFSEYEGDVIPHDHLSRLAEASRRFGRRYEDGGAEHTFVGRIRFSDRPPLSLDPPAWRVSDTELHSAALAVADVAERAIDAGVDLNVGM